MIIYIIIATLIFFGYFVKENSEKYLKVVFIILFAFSAFHNPYINGTDGFNYRRIFSYMPTLLHFKEYDMQYEVGYALLNSLVKSFSNDYFLFQVVYCLISTILLYIIVKRTSLKNEDKFLFLFVYFCFRYFQNTMEFLRQGIATEFIWIFLLSYTDVNEENSKHSISKYGLLLPAWSFHRSAVIGGLVAPVAHLLRNVDKRRITIITASVSVGLLILPTKYINQIIDIAIGVGGERYSRYLIGNEGVEQGINFINYALRWIFTIIFLISIKRIDYSKKNVIYIFACFAIMFGSIDVSIFTRLLEYFMISIYVEIALSHNLFKGKDKSLYLFVFYFAFIIILYRNLHTVSGGSYMNYELYPISN